MNVRIPKDLKNKRYERPGDIAKFMRWILKREGGHRQAQEHFWVLALDAKHYIVLIELVALGAHNRVVITPIDLFRLAVSKDATQVILVHNHPSGRLAPSQPDLDSTNRFIKAGDLIGVRVLDHLIISDKTFYSFEQKGAMAKLRASEEWTLTRKETVEEKAFRLEMEREQGKLDKSLEIARKMKKAGMSIEQIREFTNLSIQKIKKL